MACWAWLPWVFLLFRWRTTDAKGKHLHGVYLYAGVFIPKGIPFGEML